MLISLELDGRYMDEKKIIQAMHEAYLSGMGMAYCAILEIAGEKIPLRITGDCSQTQEIGRLTAKYQLTR